MVSANKKHTESFVLHVCVLTRLPVMQFGWRFACRRQEPHLKRDFQKRISGDWARMESDGVGKEYLCRPKDLLSKSISSCCVLRSDAVRGCGRVWVLSRPNCVKYFGSEARTLWLGDAPPLRGEQEEEVRRKGGQTRTGRTTALLDALSIPSLPIPHLSTYPYPSLPTKTIHNMTGNFELVAIGNPLLDMQVRDGEEVLKKVRRHNSTSRHMASC